ncbi:hypothetical protein ACVWYJ_007492 [Bradyrhizobium sp. USDA 4471]
MGIVEEAIEHGVGIGGISNEQMPLVHGELAGDDGGAMTVAIFEDFQEVVTGAGIERLEPPIIEDQQIDTAKAAPVRRSGARPRRRSSPTPLARGTR